MKTVIIDYGSGNLRSAEKAFERAYRDSGSKGSVEVTSEAEVVRTADKIVLPGVGAFDDCRAGLMAVPGMMEALNDVVIRRQLPFLGICVGMQLLASHGFEHGQHDGFDWVPGEVRAIPNVVTGATTKGGLPVRRIPHMGWNELHVAAPDHPLLAGIESGVHAYFVHSYQFKPETDDALFATTDFDGPIAAIIGRDNIVGTQFHPEKSQAIGLRLIANFLNWRP